MKAFKFLVFLLFAFGIFPAGVFAQTSGISAVAVNREVADGGAKVGDILSISPDGSLKRSEVSGDSSMVGVIADAPVISVEPKTDNTKAIVSSGEVKVNVSTAGGNISVGDYITTSTTAGVGQKASSGGYVLGRALSAYNGSGDSVILVAVAIGEHQIGASGPVGFVQSIVADRSKLKLVIGAILGIFVLAASVISIARVVTSGVTAIGRNPLARAQIMRSMFFSSFVVVLIMLAGFGAVAAIIFLGK